MLLQDLIKYTDKYIENAQCNEKMLPLYDKIAPFVSIPPVNTHLTPSYHSIVQLIFSGFIDTGH